MNQTTHPYAYSAHCNKGAATLTISLPVAIYLRKSRSDIEAEARGEGETLSRHKTALLQMAKDHNYDVCAIYQEIVSGDQIIARPQMQQLLRDVAAGRFYAVLCMDLDRLGRGDLSDQGLIQNIFKESGTQVITPRKHYNLRDEWDEEWSEFEAFFARRELKMITRRLQRGRRLSASEGKSISQHPPYGYLRNESLRLEPDPQTAPIVQQIFAWASADDKPTTIARKLNAAEIPAPRGGKWQASSVTFILQNPAYLGTIVWGKYQYHKTGTRYRREVAPADLWITKAMAHPPLITDAELPNRPVKPPHAPATINPLSALLYCYHCGHPLQFRKSYGKRQHRLICATPACPTRSGPYVPIKNAVIAETAKHYSFLRLPQTVLQESLFSGITANHLFPEAAKIENDAMTVADLLSATSSPAVEAFLLQILVKRIVYRRDKDWPQEEPITLEIWMKI